MLTKVKGAVFDIDDNKLEDSLKTVGLLDEAGDPITSASGVVKNAIINGNFDIWQRGQTGTIQNTAGYVAADRWATRFQTSGVGTIDQSGNSPDFARYSAKVTRDSGQTSTNTIQLLQVIETQDATKYRGGDITLSFWVIDAGSATNTTLVSRVATGTGVDQGSDGAADNSWTGYVAADQNNTLTGTWTKYTQTVAIGSGVQEIAIAFHYTGVGTAGADDGYFITGVQVESGDTASDFERRTFGEELALCQRYYEQETSGEEIYQGDVTNGSTYNYAVTFATTKRAIPTMTTTSAGQDGFTTARGTAGVSTNIHRIYSVANATKTPGHFFTNWAADAEL